MILILFRIAGTQFGVAWAVLLSGLEHVMLKITAIDGGRQRTLVVEGALVEPWLSELERTWTETRRRNGMQTLVIDLKDVTAISDRGEDLLYRMMTAGAEFQCCRGVLTKHVLQQLERRREARGRKDEDQL